MLMLAKLRPAHNMMFRFETYAQRRSSRLFTEAEDAIGRVFDDNVRRSVGCKTFFPKVA